MPRRHSGRKWALEPTSDGRLTGPQVCFLEAVPGVLPECMRDLESTWLAGVRDVRAWAARWRAPEWMVTAAGDTLAFWDVYRARIPSVDVPAFAVEVGEDDAAWVRARHSHADSPPIDTSLDAHHRRRADDRAQGWRALDTMAMIRSRHRDVADALPKAKPEHFAWAVRRLLGRQTWAEIAARHHATPDAVRKAVTRLKLS